MGYQKKKKKRTRTIGYSNLLTPIVFFIFRGELLFWPIQYIIFGIVVLTFSFATLVHKL